VDNDLFERIMRRVTAALPRRKVAAVIFSATPLLWLARSRDARAGRETARPSRRDGEPGPQPVPPKCSKLDGECFVNRDCCGPGTRCQNMAGSRKCRCRLGRVACAGICCPVGQACCGRCANLQTDPNNCGACFTVCATDETCVAGSCTA
jgi:hypothetical protein